MILKFMLHKHPHEMFIILGVHFKSLRSVSHSQLNYVLTARCHQFISQGQVMGNSY